MIQPNKYRLNSVAANFLVIGPCVGGITKYQVQVSDPAALLLAY